LHHLSHLHFLPYQKPSCDEAHPNPVTARGEQSRREVLGDYQTTPFSLCVKTASQLFRSQLSRSRYSRANLWRDLRLHRHHATVLDGAGNEGSPAGAGKPQNPSLRALLQRSAWSAPRWLILSWSIRLPFCLFDLFLTVVPAFGPK
jgi:hypothetical protein